MPDLERYRQLVEEGHTLDRNTILNLITLAQRTEDAEHEASNERGIGTATAILLHNVRELHKPVSFWYVSGYDETLYDSEEEAKLNAEGTRVYEYKTCSHCLEAGEYETIRVSYPCPTIRSLDGAE